MKRIAVLTSSRADYGIYLPLIIELRKDPFFELSLIVFGTHLSQFHGRTVNQILNDGFTADYQIESLVEGDSEDAVSTSMALTILKFSDFWKYHKSDFDLVFCLGDRFEMFSAVCSGIPFGVKFAHIHGGEKTLGSIDNIFRQSISLASNFHFVSCRQHASRVAELIESENNIFDVGSLSLDNLESIPLLTFHQFLETFNVDIQKPTILVTLHPDTVDAESNKSNVEKLAEALIHLTNYQVIITLPNADANNSIIRERFLSLAKKKEGQIKCFENMGTQGYFTAMQHCSFLLGNSSSGIIEAASFKKWVINTGDRQKGRIQSENVINTSFEVNDILNAIRKIEDSPVYTGTNIYHKGNAAINICSILKTLLT